MVIPLEARVLFRRRVAALQPLVQRDQTSADEVAQAVLHSWTVRAYPDLALGRAPNGTGHLIGNKKVGAFVDWLTSIPKFDEAAYWMATAYAALVGEETRTQRALYFTHPVLAERVIKDLVAQGASLVHHHWHDPACGGAAFLVPVALRMAEALKAEGFSAENALQRIERNLSGNDLDPTLIRFSQTFLTLALANLVREAGRRPDVKIAEGDGLRPVPTNGLPDVVICNPPYRKLKAIEVLQYRGTFSEAIQGQPNLYALFIEQSLRLARPGGLVGLLTPTSYLAGPMFSSLRKHVTRQAQVLAIDLLGNRKATFLNVMQETAIATLRTSPPVDGGSTAVAVWTGKEFEHVIDVRLNCEGGPWVLPRACADADLLLGAAQSKFRLSDYGFRPKVGNMVAYRTERVTHSTKPSAIGGELVLPLVWATDISPDGQFIHGRPQRKHRPEQFMEVGSFEVPGVFRRPAVLLQRLTSTEQPRRLVAAALPGEFLSTHKGFICENHVVALEQLAESLWSPEEIAQLLKSSTVDRLFRTISGASNVGIYELGQLPLPKPAALREALTSGLAMEDAIRTAFNT